MALAQELSWPTPLPAIPKVRSVELAEGRFSLYHDTQVTFSGQLSEEAIRTASLLGRLTGFIHRALPVPRSGKPPIRLAVGDVAEKADYQVKVRPTGITITGKDRAGLRAGISALVQSLPAQRLKAGQPLSLPALTFAGKAPIVKKRAFQLDLASHLFSVATVKDLLKDLALYQYNILVLELANEHAWRLQLPFFPELIEKGATRPATPYDKITETTYGGFYSLDQLKDLSETASSLGITLIPAFSLVDRVDPILAAYPKLSGQKTEFTPNYWQAEPTAMPDSKTANNFLENFIRDLADVLPNKTFLPTDRPESIQARLAPAAEFHQVRLYSVEGWTTFDLTVNQFPRSLYGKELRPEGTLTAKDLYLTDLPKDTPGVLTRWDSTYTPEPSSLSYELFARLAALTENLALEKPDWKSFTTRWPAASQYHLLQRKAIAGLYEPPTRTTIGGTKITTDWPHKAEHWPELAFDGRADTYFESEGALLAQSTFTVAFPVVATGQFEILTGLPGQDKKLAQTAVVEQSSDGVEWTDPTFFSESVARGFFQEGARQLRVTLLEDHPEGLAIPEIVLSSALLIPDFRETRIVTILNQRSEPLSFAMDVTAYPELLPQVGIIRNAWFASLPHTLRLAGDEAVPLLPKQTTLKVTPGSSWLDPKKLAAATIRELYRSVALEQLSQLTKSPSKAPEWLLDGLLSWTARTASPVADSNDRDHLQPDSNPLKNKVSAGYFVDFLLKRSSDRAHQVFRLALADNYHESLWKTHFAQTLPELIKDWQKTLTAVPNSSLPTN